MIRDSHLPAWDEGEKIASVIDMLISLEITGYKIVDTLL